MCVWRTIAAGPQSQIFKPVCTENSDSDVVVMQSTEESM
jgi:hypothetical protein